MEAFMHLDKENGDLCFLTSKASSGHSALYSRGSQLMGKTKRNSVKVQAPRKVLGNVNQHVPSRKSAPKQVQKSRNVDILVRRSEKMYPEIETFIPYDPLDFERFDVPEEHKLSDRCLAGVPLFVSVAKMKNFAALTSLDLSPMENHLIHCDYDTFTPTFEDLMVALPVMCDF